MNVDIVQRIRRVYAAIGAVEEADPNKLRATVIQTERVKAVFQDFRGGLTDEALSNLAHSLIQNIANVADHLRKWARQNGRDIGACPVMLVVRRQRDPTCIGSRPAHCGCDCIQRATWSTQKNEPSQSWDVATYCGHWSGSVV